MSAKHEMLTQIASAYEALKIAENLLVETFKEIEADKAARTALAKITESKAAVSCAWFSLR